MATQISELLIKKTKSFAFQFSLETEKCVWFRVSSIVLSEELLEEIGIGLFRGFVPLATARRCLDI